MKRKDFKNLLLFLHQIGPKKRMRFIRSIDDCLKCHYCRCNLDFSGDNTKRSATNDHILPRSKGGKTIPENIIIACHKCNSNRGSKDYVEFLRERRKI